MARIASSFAATTRVCAGRFAPMTAKFCRRIGTWDANFDRGAKAMIRLGVNIDHVATLRQARQAQEPDPVAAAVLALLGGADGITVHLREDRRHINDRDVRLLRQVVTTLLNLELSVADEIVTIACEL